jgi:hypothetical protein
MRGREDFDAVLQAFLEKNKVRDKKLGGASCLKRTPYVPELAKPRDLPEGTETIVKVQWPQRGDCSVMIYAKDLKHLRLINPDDLPLWLYKQFDPDTVTYCWAVVRHGEWD